MEKAKRAFQGIYGMMWDKPLFRKHRLNEGRNALIVVDMVNGFIREGEMKNPLAEEIIEPIVTTMKYFKEKGMPIVAFADCHDEAAAEFKQYPKHCIKGTHEAELVDEIKEEGGYFLVEKNSTNGALEERFMQWLEENPNITEFVVTGVCTDICVMQFCLTLKAMFDKNNKESRFIIPLDMVETFDFRSHQITLVNTMAIFFMEQSGVEIYYDMKN